MNKKTQITNTLERMGFTPHVDEEGDIYIMYQLKHIFFLTTEDEADLFISMYLPTFCEIPEGEDHLYMSACSTISRDTKILKVYVDKTGKHIGASCDFYFNNEETLEMNISKALPIFAIVRSIFRSCVEELSK